MDEEIRGMLCTKRWFFGEDKLSSLKMSLIEKTDLGPMDYAQNCLNIYESPKKLLKKSPKVFV